MAKRRKPKPPPLMPASTEVSVGVVEGIIVMRLGRRDFNLTEADARFCRKLLKHAIRVANEEAA